MNSLNAQLLTREDEIRLAELIEAGRNAARESSTGRPDLARRVRDGEAARERFILANTRLVRHIARTYTAPHGMTHEDLVQDGMLGLIEAVDGFDWRRGCRFSTYAGTVIRRRISRVIAEAGAARLPAHRATELRRTEGALPPDLAVIAALRDAISTDDLTLTGDATSPEDALIDGETRAELLAYIESLDPFERDALWLRFSGDEPLHYARIGEMLGVSRETARRAVEAAVDRLRYLAKRDIW